MVRVCPPVDSNTALFHNLLKIDKNSVTEEDRKASKDGLHEIHMSAWSKKRPRAKNADFEVHERTTINLSFSSVVQAEGGYP